jgi:tetratricopeptide (TPR) repeat protein
MDVEEKLKILAESVDNYKGGKDVKSLSNLLLDDTRRRAEAEKWFNRAYDEGQKGNKETAIEYYTKAIELNPEDATAYENLSELYIITGNYKSALDAITEALSLSLEIEDRAVCLFSNV